MGLLLITTGVLTLLFFVASALAYITDPERVDEEERNEIERQISWER